MVGAGQIATKLQIVGRVGEDKVDARRSKLLQLIQAIPFNDDVLLYACHPFFSFFQRVVITTRRAKPPQVNHQCMAFLAITISGAGPCEGLII